MELKCGPQTFQNSEIKTPSRILNYYSILYSRNNFKYTKPALPNSLQIFSAKQKNPYRMFPSDNVFLSRSSMCGCVRTRACVCWGMEVRGVVGPNSQLLVIILIITQHPVAPSLGRSRASFLVRVIASLSFNVHSRRRGLTCKTTKE